MQPPLRRPPPLREGDRAVVVAPAGPADADRLARGVEVLATLGLRVRVAPHVLDRDENLPHLAGADADRARDLSDAWCDPSVAAVVCARGGYGAMRVLEHLDLDVFARQPPKVLLGGSDVTALHLAFAARARSATFFGPMPATDVLGGPGGPDPASLAGLRAALLGEGPVVVRTSTPWALVPGVAEGVTVGGTLSLVTAALGSGDLPPADGCVVLLEDVGEEAYRVDRMLTTLRRAGWFDGVAGLALGSWESCGPGMRDVLDDRLAPLGVPVLGGLPFGHGRPQLTVPLGVPAVLDVGRGTLSAVPPGGPR